MRFETILVTSRGLGRATGPNRLMEKSFASATDRRSQAMAVRPGGAAGKGSPVAAVPQPVAGLIGENKP
jgi:hypothetical protein